MEWVEGLDGRKMQAVAGLARRGTASNPGIVGHWLTLGRALIDLGEFRDAAACVREAIAVLPQSAELRLVLVEALLMQDLFEEALPHAETAVVIAPGHAHAMRLYCYLLDVLKCWDKAVLDRDAIFASSGSNSGVMAMHAKSLGAAGALELWDSQLAANPAHTDAKYLKAIALAAVGHAEEARQLLAFDRLIEICDLPAPPGYADEQSFRDTLAREIRANPTLARDPRGKATRDGLQTRHLRQPDALAIETLLVQIKLAADAYEQRLAASGDDFALGRPRKARLDAWAVIYGSAGRQKAHRHPDGWLSGVYYVAAPRLHGKNTAYRGHLIMGALDSEENGTPWGTRKIEPVPGRLVLFPSYVPHATEPSGIDGARISVAFDIVPVHEDSSALRFLDVRPFARHI